MINANDPQLCGVLVVIIAVLLIIYGLVTTAMKQKIEWWKNENLNKMKTIKDQSDLIANLSKKLNKYEKNGND